MSELSVADLALRLDDLLKEVRRQGRAAVAAQAAAESCLEAIQAQAEGSKDSDLDGDEQAAAAAATEETTRWLRALIPVADSLDRVIRQAAMLDAPRREKRGLFARLLAGRPSEPKPDEARGNAALAALNEGLRVLRAQLEGTLHELGVSVDRRTGGPVDGERQRVVEVRERGPGERRGTVVEVVRPGYALGAKIVREAEVVVADGDPAKGS
jgi:molecular chaperone GrpE (heat shock protein)